MNCCPYWIKINNYLHFLSVSWIIAFTFNWSSLAFLSLAANVLANKRITHTKRKRKSQMMWNMHSTTSARNKVQSYAVYLLTLQKCKVSKGKG